MKKRIFVLLTVVISILIFLYLSTSARFANFVNWKIILPKFQKEDIIFTDFFQDGEKFAIFTFKTDKQVKKLISSNHLNTINSENISEVKEQIHFFHNQLKDDFKALLESNINNLLIEDCDHYLIKRKYSDSFIILLLNSKTRKLYWLEMVRN